MSVARKISVLILILVGLCAAIVTSLSLSQAFKHERQRMLEEIQFLIRAQPTLPLTLHYRQLSAQQAQLDQFLQWPAVRYGKLYDRVGTSLVETTPLGANNATAPSFVTIRADAEPTATSVIVRKSNQPSQGSSLVALLTGLTGERISDVAVPIFSPVNPSRVDLPEAQFFKLLLGNSGADSIHVVGYLHVGISHTGIWDQLADYSNRLLLGCLLLMLLTAVLAVYYSRRIASPLARLAAMAEDVASGKVDVSLPEDGDGEVREISTMLNTILKGLNTYKARIDVDHQLLSLKVEERNAQLNERDQELSKAVEEVTRTREDLRKMAYFDSLTDLPNRRLFTEQLGLLLRLAKRQGTSLALLFLDLDNFKRINDSLGHSAGDELLREVGRRLARGVRDSDVVAHYSGSDTTTDVSRLGGDEFTVVLNQITSPAAAGMVADRLLQLLSEPMNVSGHDVVITPSIGIAVGPQDAEDVDGLLKAADIAMYHAKQDGKNCYLHYRSDMVGANVERLLLETDLRRAVDKHQLTLYYQPQVDTATGTVVGVEALIRWIHPTQGLVSPARFIPLAEEMGLIVEIGAWATTRACRDMQRLRNDGFALKQVSVNVSALEFSAGLVPRVAEAITASGIEPGLLKLELTEGVVIDQGEATLATLNSLKQLGVALSIDDFGTGYSSLSYLSRFPLDELKIDRSFVIDLETSDNARKLVAAIIAMGRSLNLRLVAEGVETGQQLQFLDEHGVDVIQGFLYSKPVSLNDLIPLLQQGHFKNR